MEKKNSLPVVMQFISDFVTADKSDLQQMNVEERTAALADILSKPVSSLPGTKIEKLCRTVKEFCSSNKSFRVFLKFPDLLTFDDLANYYADTKAVKVEVSRNIFTCALEIKLNPATAVANVKKNDRYYLVSENGRIMDAELKAPDKNCVVVLGFDPEYAKSGDFLSVTDEGSRNMLTKLLRAVKTYDEIDDENEYEAQQKYDCVFALIELCKELDISGHIKTIDISSIYGIKLNYDNKLTLELGDMTDAKLKLTVGKNLIDKGEFDGEKGVLVLSQLSENTYNMKVTFRPEYDDTSKDDTSSSEPEPTPDTPDNSEPVPGDTTEPSESAE